jgi:hypothetical protein
MIHHEDALDLTALVATPDQVEQLPEGAQDVGVAFEVELFAFALAAEHFFGLRSLRVRSGISSSRLCGRLG